MEKVNSYELFVKNPKIHTHFPFNYYDCNNKKTLPSRSRFQEIHWHEDMQITYVIEGVLKIISLDKVTIVHQGEVVFLNKKVLHQFIEIEPSHYRTFIFPDKMIHFYELSPMENDISKMNISVYLVKKQEMIELVKRINNVCFGIYQEKHK